MAWLVTRTRNRNSGPPAKIIMGPLCHQPTRKIG